ncbi:MAG: CRISPR-associated helicase Cas3' [Christensenellales bacterium]|jgi:CRISPR-associated endonuclease/helicase Cas3
MSRFFIARKHPDGRTQGLCEHSKNVAKIAILRSFWPKILKLIAYLHDVGKIPAMFQRYIKCGGERGSVIHAWQGAFLANELFPSDDASAALLKEIIGFCVTGHHNYLPDGVSPDGSSNYIDKFSNAYDKKYSFDEIKEKITAEEKAELQRLFDDAKSEITDVLATIRAVYKEEKSAFFALGLFIKYLFSCLVDADRLDAHLSEIKAPYSKQTTDWKLLIDIFEENISKFPDSTPMDKIRRSVSEKCRHAAKIRPGIYQLLVPTGGGKTLSSLRLALHNCEEYSKERIIYVIPYLSIIDQTAKSLRDILNLPKDNDVIFEHHSNIAEPEDEAASQIRKQASARWDSPIIITTMVQFLESLMSSKSGKLRKFASLANSVIIFDEIQSMPINAIHCFNEIATFLSQILNATIILCSATQPALEATQRKNLMLAADARLIDCREDFKSIKRAKVQAESEKDCESASSFILEKAGENGNCLVIVNTKKSALEIYKRLKSKTDDFKILHLSTSMCSVHRVQIIEEMKAALNVGERIICVSTQLIEAGVDISFACVVRAMAGLDSIAQAAGRCNRSAESAEPKAVYTFALKDENLDKLIDIRSGKEVTEQIIRNENGDADLLDERIMAEFYKRYFSGKDGQMDYRTEVGDSVYAMLCGNKCGKSNYQNRTGEMFSHLISHAFHSADESFSVIDKNTVSVVVMFGGAEGLIEEYRRQPAKVVTKKIAILRELQKHSVSLYAWERERLGAQNALYPLDEETGALVLGANYYSQDTGVVLEPIWDTFIV